MNDFSGFFRWLLAVFVSFGLLLAANAATPPPATEKRVALVIGNSTYANTPLRNPINDAKDMAARLRTLGFEVVERNNLTTRQIGGTLREFRSKLSPGAVALVFYAGHGLQIKGENYLPTVDADINSEEDVPNQSISVKQVMDVLDDAKTRLNLVFLDACRNNPYARSFRSNDRGLARISAPSGTLISYATRPGSVAADGVGRNGLYTGELLAQMAQTQAPIEQVLKRVVTNVKGGSQGKQEPWMEGSIEGDFCFGGCTSGSAPTAVPARSDAEFEQALWNNIKNIASLDSIDVYLRQYPQGQFVTQARVLLEKLKVNAIKTGQPSGVAVIDKPQALGKPTYRTGQVFQDCPHCPSLVVIPAGSFIMGSNAAEQVLANSAGEKVEHTNKESPQHKVVISSFAAGRFALTKGEFSEFIKSEGYKTEAEQADGCAIQKDGKLQKNNDSNWRNVGFPQGDDHPVVCVSWNDAQAYVRWLSQLSGKSYRLLSESEREYATRAGSTSAFWWGDTINTNQANYRGTRLSYNGSPKGELRNLTVPVNSFAANPFGLYNVHGNVMEWVQDCAHVNYDGAPTDGRTWADNCSSTSKIIRGGNYGFSGSQLRSANRSFPLPPTNAFAPIGFRVARNLETP